MWGEMMLLVRRGAQRTCCWSPPRTLCACSRCAVCGCSCATQVAHRVARRCPHKAVLGVGSRVQECPCASPLLVCAAMPTGEFCSENHCRPTPVVTWPLCCWIVSQFSVLHPCPEVIGELEVVRGKPCIIAGSRCTPCDTVDSGRVQPALVLLT